MRILIGAGATGGHAAPALALAWTLRKKGAEVHLLFSGAQASLFFGRAATSRPYARRGALHAPLTPNIHTLSLQGWDRGSKLGWLRAGFALLLTLWQTAGLIRRIKPDALVGMGGALSLAFAFFASRKRPLFLHEANAVPGLGNWLASFRARWVGLNLPLEDNCFSLRKRSLVGMPVRDETRLLKRKPPATPVLLVLGGSQGAQTLNETMIKLKERLFGEVKGLRILHVAGAANAERMGAFWGENSRIRIYGFCRNMAGLYKRATLALSRAGASTLAEISAAGVPAVLIPYPFSSENHQKANAKYFEASGAGLVVEEKNIYSLGDILVNLLRDPNRLRRMGMASRGLYQKNAAESFAEIMMKHAS